MNCPYLDIWNSALLWSGLDCHVSGVFHCSFGPVSSVVLLLPSLKCYPLSGLCIGHKAGGAENEGSQGKGKANAPSQTALRMTRQIYQQSEVQTQMYPSREIETQKISDRCSSFIFFFLVPSFQSPQNLFTSFLGVQDTTTEHSLFSNVLGKNERLNIRRQHLNIKRQLSGGTKEGQSSSHEAAILRTVSQISAAL